MVHRYYRLKIMNFKLWWPYVFAFFSALQFNIHMLGSRGLIPEVVPFWRVSETLFTFSLSFCKQIRPTYYIEYLVLSRNLRFHTYFQAWLFYIYETKTDELWVFITCEPKCTGFENAQVQFFNLSSFLFFFLFLYFRVFRQILSDAIFKGFYFLQNVRSSVNHYL